ncbi:MAG: hypothetical protein ACXWBS_07590 [Chthoniobacterales bacterium]
MQRTAFSFLILFLSLAAMQAQLPSPSSSEPLFKERPYGPVPPPTPTPMHKIIEPEGPPIPIGYIIGGVAAVAVGVAIFLYGSARQWHSSNLFDRQYRFPRPANVAMRFGAKRFGGHMATVQFDSSKSKNT